jgi:hypothetical protein
MMYTYILYGTYWLLDIILCNILFTYNISNRLFFFQDSPYRTLISESVLRLQESGFMRELKDKWWKVQGGNKCEASVYSE